MSSSPITNYSQTQTIDPPTPTGLSGFTIQARENQSTSTGLNRPQSDEKLFRVVIIDNDHNTYDEVIYICQQALGISPEQAFQIALAVDHNGRAEVFEGSRNAAESVAQVIRQIGIEVRVELVN